MSARPTDFACHLSSFLGDYLPQQRNFSANTIFAYRDTFCLFLRYCRDHQELPAEKLSLKDINAALILDFLQHLRTERNCSVKTTNLRLSALHSFFRYVQIEEPHQISRCQRILAIPTQRCARPAVEFLEPNEIQKILEQPNRSTRQGIRDSTLLAVAYDTAARVQELIDLRVRDVRLSAPAQIRLTGKGNKARAVPILDNTVALLSFYIDAFGLSGVENEKRPLFANRFGNPFSRSGIRYLLNRYVEQARANFPSLRDRVTPHTLRHSKAMHLMHSGNPLAVIAEILGHVDINTS
jgi:integrase/recombinase XerD